MIGMIEIRFEPKGQCRKLSSLLKLFFSIDDSEQFLLLIMVRDQH